MKEAGGSIVAYERWLRPDQAQLDEIALYNREDVHSTRGLRDWLLGLREELSRRGDEGVAPGAPSDDRESRGDRPRHGGAARALRTGEHDRLLGELLLYHRREAKPTWWW